MRDPLIRGGVEPAVEPLPKSHLEARRLRGAGGVRADELLASFNAMRDERRPYHDDFVKMMVNLVPMLAGALKGSTVAAVLHVIVGAMKRDDETNTFACFLAEATIARRAHVSVRTVARVIA